MDMNNSLIQNQYDKIYSYFKTTTESFDSFEWDGKILSVINNNMVVEIYKYKFLKKIIKNIINRKNL